MFKHFLIAILALAVVAAAVFVGGKYLGKEAADWKTYNNEEYGFSLKYPPTLQLIEEDLSDFAREWSDGYIKKAYNLGLIKPNKEQLLSVSINVGWGGAPANKLSQKIIKRDDIEITENLFQSVQDPNNYYLSYRFTYKGNYFDIRTEPENESVADTIVQTLRFY